MDKPGQLNQPRISDEKVVSVEHISEPEEDDEVVDPEATGEALQSEEGPVSPTQVAPADNPDPEDPAASE